MSYQLTIELPDEIGRELERSVASPQQLASLLSGLVRIYLRRDQLQDVLELMAGLPEPGGSKPVPRFGSGRHLGIQLSKDFDEPLEDFAEYMQ
ncbi:MAG: type II toxin-antitoxin system prevent-host-death family antitoxin [Chloroflexi bacterium]|nr:type II toxin-antitoxin system prevent-host-death family antitoxin [Chloroflexota bacterium]